MPHEIVQHPQFDSDRSLGWLVGWWIEKFTVHGPGEVQGQPGLLTNEQYRFVVGAYSLNENARRLHTTSFYSRPKGCDKSGMAARIVLAEAFGPVRFAGFAEGGETYTFMGHVYTYAKGEPMGKSVKVPFIRIMATEEDQAGNTYDTVYYNLTNRHAPLFAMQALGCKPGLLKTDLPGGGEIVPSTTGASSKDGGKETFFVADEALALDTPIPTPGGWRTMGDLSVGDFVFASDGSPTRVVKTTGEFTDRRCFRVTFRDGTHLTASAGHMWSTRVVGSAAKERVRTTLEMFEDGRKFSVPPSGAVQYPESDLPIDPYVLGYWLGDGDARNATITVAEDDADGFVQNITARGYTVRECAVTGHRSPLYYVSIPGSGKGRFATEDHASPVSGLKVRLRRLGLLSNKHIPAEYMRGSIEQRRDLLRGIADSDGWASRDRGSVCIGTNKRAFAEQIVELVRSLGESPHISTSQDTRQRTGEYLRVGWTPTLFNPFQMGRKRDRVPLNLRRRTTITSIVEVDPVPVKCIAVEHDSHLFLAGEGAKVTHNTHLHIKPGLKEAVRTVKRNLVKRGQGAWLLETTTMFGPGQESTAEDTYGRAKRQAEGRERRPSLYMDHRYGALLDDEGKPTELDDETSLLRALEDAYGDSTWVDLEGVMDLIYDTTTPIDEAFRYYLNVQHDAKGQWLAGVLLEAAVERAKGLPPLADGDKVVIGFDGSINNDSTVIVICRVSDGLLALHHIQEQPDGPESEDWAVDREQVDIAMREAFDLYEVVGLYCDPPHFQSYVDKWASDFKDRLEVYATPSKPTEFWTNRQTEMVDAVDRLALAFRDGDVAVEPGTALQRHLINARQWKRPQGIVIGKETKHSPRKVDAAVAACIAWIARAHLLTRGKAKEKPKKPQIPIRVR